MNLKRAISLGILGTSFLGGCVGFNEEIGRDLFRVQAVRGDQFRDNILNPSELIIPQNQERYDSLTMNKPETRQRVLNDNIERAVIQHLSPFTHGMEIKFIDYPIKIDQMREKSIFGVGERFQFVQSPDYNGRIRLEVMIGETRYYDREKVARSFVEYKKGNILVTEYQMRMRGDYMITSYEDSSGKILGQRRVSVR